MSRRSVESVGGVFDPVVSSAIAVFEQLWSCHESSLDAAVSRRDKVLYRVRPKWHQGV